MRWAGVDTEADCRSGHGAPRECPKFHGPGVQLMVGLVRLYGMIANLHRPTGHPVAQELLLRATAVGFTLVAILGLLPAIARAAA